MKVISFGKYVKYIINMQRIYFWFYQWEYKIYVGSNRWKVVILWF